MGDLNIRGSTVLRVVPAPLQEPTQHPNAKTDIAKLPESPIILNELRGIPPSTVGLLLKVKVF